MGPDREDGPLRVLDVGCGGGDGLSLLRSASRRLLAPGSLHYKGLDINDGLLAAGRWLHRESDDIHFVHGDVRDGIPEGQFDLFLSCGVPYSHLTATDLETTRIYTRPTAEDRNRAVNLLPIDQ